MTDNDTKNLTSNMFNDNLYKKSTVKKEEKDNMTVLYIIKETFLKIFWI